MYILRPVTASWATAVASSGSGRARCAGPYCPPRSAPSPAAEPQADRVGQDELRVGSSAATAVIARRKSVSRPSFSFYLVFVRVVVGQVPVDADHVVRELAADFAVQELLRRKLVVRR